MPHKTKITGASDRKASMKLSHRGRKRPWSFTFIIVSLVVAVVLSGIGIVYYQMFHNNINRQIGEGLRVLRNRIEAGKYPHPSSMRR